MLILPIFDVFYPFRSGLIYTYLCFWLKSLPFWRLSQRIRPIALFFA